MSYLENPCCLIIILFPGIFLQYPFHSKIMYPKHRYFLDTADSGSGSGFSFFGGGKQAITQPKVDTADKAKEARAAQVRDCLIDFNS